MRVLATLIFFALLATASANTIPSDSDGLQAYVDSLSSVDGRSNDGSNLLPLLRKLQEKRGKIQGEAGFIGYLFDKTRREFLRSYSAYATFSETLTSGTYNCLTGTALYAILLDHFHIPYEIIETNYHIFLIVNADNEQILLEATDGQHGFVTGASNIEERIRNYRQGLGERADDGKSYYRYYTDVYKQVSLDELTGLLYFNRAIVAYNGRDLPAAIEQLAKSAEHYQSPRTTEFVAILQVSVTESSLNTELKQHCLRKLQHLHASVTPFSARNN